MSIPSTVQLANETRKHIDSALANGGLSPMDIQKLTDSQHKLWRIEKESQGMVPMVDVDRLSLAVGRALRNVIMAEDCPKEPGILLARLGKAVNDAQAEWAADLKK